MSNIKGDTCDVCFLRLCVDFPTKKQICFAHAQRQREWARERKWAGVRKLPLGFPLLLMSFCVCLPFVILTSSVVYQFDCFIYFFSIFFINFSVSLSLFLSFPALTLIKKQTPVNEERWKRPKQCGIKSENQKWNVWLLEQTTLLLLLSWVICESKNQECVNVCVCWKKRVKTSKNSIKDKAKP